MEISQPFEALRQQLWKMSPSHEYLIFYKAPLLLPKLLPSQKKLYSPSLFSQGWLVEDVQKALPDSPPDISSSAQHIYELLADSKSFARALAASAPCAIAIKDADTFWRVTLLPILDVEGFSSALLMSFTPDPQLRAFDRSYYWSVLSLSLLIALGGWLTFQTLQKKELVYEKQQRLQLIANTMSDGLLVITNEGSISFVNRAGAEILGRTLNEMVDQMAHDFLHPHDPGQNPAIQCSICKALHDGKDGRGHQGEDVFIRKDGSSFVAEVNASPMIMDGKGVGLVLIFRDITERKKNEDQLYQLSHTDPLTNIFNRRHFINVLENEVERVKRYGAPLSLAICDIDHFKLVNDSFGHAVGDRVLQGIVATIQKRVRATDVFARWGGEEFVLMLPHTTLADAVPMAQKILSTIRRVDFGEVGMVTISFGVTTFRGEDTIDTLISRADSLLYKAKAEGRNCVRSSE